MHMFKTHSKVHLTKIDKSDNMCYITEIRKLKNHLIFVLFFIRQMEEIFRKKAEQDEEDEETVSLLTKYKGTPDSVCIPLSLVGQMVMTARPCD